MSRFSETRLQVQLNWTFNSSFLQALSCTLIPSSCGLTSGRAIPSGSISSQICMSCRVWDAVVQWSERWRGTPEVLSSSLRDISFFFTKLVDDFPRRDPNDFRGKTTISEGYSEDVPKISRRWSEGFRRFPEGFPTSSRSLPVQVPSGLGHVIWMLLSDWLCGSVARVTTNWQIQ